jgi:hypothetical protein
MISAASIAITALGATPAQADEDDLAKALAVIAGIAIIGKVIHDKKKRDQQVTRHDNVPLYSEPRPRHPHVQPRHPHVQPYGHPHVQPRPLPRQVDRRLLPPQCFRSYDTRRGTVRVFGTRCLKQNYRFANRLPQHCLVSFKGHAGRQTGYDARCLRDQGYRLARG